MAKTQKVSNCLGWHLGSFFVFLHFGMHCYLQRKCCLFLSNDTFERTKPCSVPAAAQGPLHIDEFGDFESETSCSRTGTVLGRTRRKYASVLLTPVLCFESRAQTNH